MILSGARERSQLNETLATKNAKDATGASFVPLSRNRLPEPLSRHLPHNRLWEPVTSSL